MEGHKEEEDQQASEREVGREEGEKVTDPGTETVAVATATAAADVGGGGGGGYPAAIVHSSSSSSSNSSSNSSSHLYVFLSLLTRCTKKKKNQHNNDERLPISCALTLSPGCSSFFFLFTSIFFFLSDPLSSLFLPHPSSSLTFTVVHPLSLLHLLSLHAQTPNPPAPPCHTSLPYPSLSSLSPLHSSSETPRARTL